MTDSGYLLLCNPLGKVNGGQFLPLNLQATYKIIFFDMGQKSLRFLFFDLRFLAFRCPVRGLLVCYLDDIQLRVAAQTFFKLTDAAPIKGLLYLSDT